MSKAADNLTFTLIHVILDLAYELELTLTSNALFMTSTSLMCSTENSVFNYFTNNEKTTGNGKKTVRYPFAGLPLAHLNSKWYLVKG